jgi:hypothetical protein
MPCARYAHVPRRTVAGSVRFGHAPTRAARRRGAWARRSRRPARCRVGAGGARGRRDRSPIAGEPSRPAFPGVHVVPSPAWAVPEADVVVVAVKPGDVAACSRARRRPSPTACSCCRSRRVSPSRRSRPRARAVPSCGPCPTRPRWCARGGRDRRRAAASDADLDLAEARARLGAAWSCGCPNHSSTPSRAVGIGSRVRVPPRRGDDRGRGARRASARQAPRARDPDAARSVASGRGRGHARVAARRGHVTGGRPPPAWRELEAHGFRSPCSTRCRPPPSDPASWVRPLVSRRPRRNRPPRLDVDPVAAVHRRPGVADAPEDAEGEGPDAATARARGAASPGRTRTSAATRSRLDPRARRWRSSGAARL